MLDKLKDTFNKSVAAVSVKSESIVESSRVRTAITNTQRNMDAMLSALGVTVYNSWVAGNIDVAALEEECRKINEVNAELSALKIRLEKIKAEENQILGSQKVPAVEAVPAAAAGSVFCTNCGKKLEAGSRFCDECGTQVTQ